jgi:hypothetical protein
MNRQNKLWKPGKGEDCTRKSKVKKIDDELCLDCPNNDKSNPACLGVCNPMQYINGNKQSREILLTDINTKEMEYRDYKEDLIEMIEHRQQRVNKAIEVKNIKHRAIAILLLAGITQKDISNLFCMSYRQINRISNKIKH